MLTYRMYFMNRYNGHIMHFKEFEASDDRVATRLCEREVADSPIELWCDRRKVRRIDAHDHVSPFAPQQDDMSRPVY